MLRLVTLTVAVLVAYAANTEQQRRNEDFGNLVVATNYGVVFTPTERVLNGASYYLHTFAVPIPQLTYTDISQLPCDSPALKLVQCEAINEMITSLNAATKPVYTRLKKLVDESLSAINSIGRVRTSASGRSKRSVATNTTYYYHGDDDGAEPVYQYHSVYDDATGTYIHHGPRVRVRRDVNLGADFCNKKTEGGDSDGSSGLLSTLGKAGADMFGMVGWDTVKVMDKHICDLARTADINRKEIQRAERALASVSEAIENRIGAVETGMGAVNKRVTETQQQLQRVANQAIKAENELAKNQKRIELAQRQRILMQEQLNKHRQLVFEQIEAIDEFLAALDRMMDGYLPQQFVGVNDLKRLIDLIVQQVLPEHGNRFDLVSRNPSFYYKLRDIAFVRSTTFVYVTVKLPVYETGGMLQTYRVDRVHSSTAQHHESSTIVRNLPDYFLIDKNNLYYSEMRTAEYLGCRGNLLRVCRSERSLVPVNTHLTCAAAIFLGKTEAIRAKCEVGYEPNDMPSVAVDMGDGRFLVHSINASPKNTWTLSCPFSKSSAHRLQQIASCKTCFVSVPCGCSLDGTDFYVPVRMTGCPQNKQPSRPELTRKFPVNLHMMTELYTPKQLAQWTKEATATEPWELEKINLDVQPDHWDEVVAREQKYALDFKRLMAKHRAGAKAWSSKASYFLHKAMNMNDVNTAHIKDLEGQLGSGIWKSLLNVKSIVAGVSFSTFLNVVTLIVVILYAIWK